MEWIDTLMLDVASAKNSCDTNAARDCTSVIAMQGVTVLHADTTIRSKTAAALKTLRDFRAVGRRVVLCDTSQLLVGRQFGQEVVRDGAAELLISCGLSGREVGIGARDAGLDLSSVVVCNQPFAAGQVLAKQVSEGDTVLLLGFEPTEVEQLKETLAERFMETTASAA